MDCVWSAVLSTRDSPADLSGTVATLFKRVSNIEVCMHNNRRHANIYIYHTYIIIHLSHIVHIGDMLKHLYHTYIIIHVPQTVQNYIYIHTYIILCGGGHAVC